MITCTITDIRTEDDADGNTVQKFTTGVASSGRVFQETYYYPHPFNSSERWGKRKTFELVRDERDGTVVAEPVMGDYVFRVKTSY